MIDQSPDSRIQATRFRIGEVLEITQPDGRVFEKYRRPPGVRLIIVSPDNKILMTREHRHETGGVDLRLPGGKVCDTIKQYDDLLGSGATLVDLVQRAGTTEALQETGLIVQDLEEVAVAHDGATVDWDLHYLITHSYTPSPAGQELEVGEDIEVVWLTEDEIVLAIQNDEMQEYRSVGVLLGIVFPKLEAS